MRYTALKFVLLALLTFFVPANSVAEQNSNIKKEEELKRIFFQRVNYGNANDVALLVSKGADVNWKNKQEQNALMLAIIRDDDESEKIVEMLLKAGAKPNMQLEQGDFVLHQAIEFGNADIAKMLILAGAEIHQKNIDGETPIFLADYYNRPKIKDYIQVRLDEEERIRIMKSAEIQRQKIMEFYFKECGIAYLQEYKKSKKGKKDTRDFSNVLKALQLDIDSLIVFFATYHNERIPTDVLLNFTQDAKSVLKNIIRTRYPRLSSQRTLANFGTSEELNQICRFSTYSFMKRLDKAQEEKNK